MRWSAAHALGKIGGDRAEALLATALEDESADVRLVAAGQLVYVRRDRAAALLEKKAGNQFRARIFPIAAESNKEIIISYSQRLDRSKDPRRSGSGSCTSCGPSSN